MASQPTTANQLFTQATDQSTIVDLQVWDNLKSAIVQSSGFQRWQVERAVQAGANLDHLAHQYLREALETLAY